MSHKIFDNDLATIRKSKSLTNLHKFRVQQFAYAAYICMATFIGVCMILDMCTLTHTFIFP